MLTYGSEIWGYENIDKTNMENDCAFANLEDKFKEKQKVAVESILRANI
jgi:hypothetical protein